MELLDKASEDRLLGLLKQAKLAINDGVTPSTAILKVAQLNSLTPPFVQRMVETINTGLTLEHLKQSSDRRADSFPLADAEEICGQMYPDRINSPAQKAAQAYVSPVYLHKEKTNFNIKAADLRAPLKYNTKKVEPYAPDPLEKSAHIIRRKNILDKSASDAAAYACSRYEDLIRGIHKAAEYFNNVYHTPFAEVEERVCSQYGENGKMIMDLLYDTCRSKEKRATLGAQLVRAYPKQEPYHTISDLVKRAAHVGECGNAVVEAELIARAYSRQHNLTDAFAALYGEKKADAPASTSDDLTLPFAKAAFDPATIALVGGMNMLGLKEPSDNLRRDAALDASDPTHESELQSIKVKSMLNDMVSNDPVLSGHDPHEVFNAYNALAGLSPRASQQPALMRGALRRMLQQEGVMEPFEAHQMGQIEKGLTPTPDTGKM